MISMARFSGALADKHGPRLLLIAGPATAGLGLLILSFVKQTNGAADYWTTFFPGILIFGLGMSFTVAPLTTAVMGSVNDNFSGTASGVNNALTRIANVFANAILGALAVLFFTGALQRQIEQIPLNTKQKQTVMAQATNLGDAKVPHGFNTSEQATIKKLYHNSFIDVYAKVMQLSAALAFLGALMSFLFIRNSTIQKNTT
jgi:MFS family permease